MRRDDTTEVRIVTLTQGRANDKLQSMGGRQFPRKKKSRSTSTSPELPRQEVHQTVTHIVVSEPLKPRGGKFFSVLINIATILGVVVALMGWVKPIAGAVWIVLGVAYLVWEISPYLKNSIRRKPVWSLIVLIVCGAGVGATIGEFYTKSR